MRTLSKDIASHIGKTLELEGWLHKKRLLGGVNFILLRDRSGLAQIKIDDATEVAKLKNLQIGSVLKVAGKAIKDERAASGAEIHEPKIEVVVEVSKTAPIEIDKPIDHKSENLETLFENRAYNLRNINEQAIFKIRAHLNQYIREFFIGEDFTEIQTPKLLAEATEGGAEVFTLDYFGQEATLAQSPQFYKQMMVGVYERVFEIGPAFRAEPSMTTRHMSETTMLDMEMAFIENHEDILKTTERFFYNVLTKLHKEQADLLKAVGAPKLTLKADFPRFSVAEVHKLYSDSTGESTINEKDLIPAEERFICDYATKKHGCEAVFVTDFPIEAMKFYHMKNPKDKETVLWADLLFRGLEIATCPQREHRHDELVKQMKEAGLDPDADGYKYYLQAFEAGLPPHGGFGLGIDRLLQKVVGLKSVKEATLFPRDMQRLYP